MQDKTIILAGGCFWGVQAYFKKLPGVINTKVAYANGLTKQTSYKELKLTEHAEVVVINYNPNIVSLPEIILRFLSIIDPYSLNKQGEDEGLQYRTGIYYTDATDVKVIDYVLDTYVKQHDNKKLAVEVEELKNLIDAEDYHQDYLDKNPNGYCHINVMALYQNFCNVVKKVSIDEINNFSFASLSFNLPLDQEGIFVDKISKQPLFSSNDKLREENEYVVFLKPIVTDAITVQNVVDVLEIYSSIQQLHIGHVKQVEDNKNEYYINKNLLSFIDIKDIENSEFAKYIAFFVK
ncbi:peptide-methionine (S)-S-oxide reductase MsrA [Mycoplasma sp. Pen4]|uniref:peptide-methionine (S)-S-oxide reductase MsrA n=1 Tax=Mycoplasma sp. Pen4 TaxID=640330 RepID=UPI00165419DC|nr:peptide-methionine (S)-S-oxide reductase MsrA [Mycoplasma sp. Pen4]QNM93772.1 peptide-methionine (S)-S-oxide reductase MsrA [Mycoplasma sp. Pen4]